MLSPSLARPALAVRVAACLLARAPGGEGPILVRALGGGPSGRVTAWVTPVTEALPSLGLGCPTLAIRVADCLLAWAPGKAPSL